MKKAPVEGPNIGIFSYSCRESAQDLNNGAVTPYSLSRRNSRFFTSSP
jgi:hypothetical protein